MPCEQSPRGDVWVWTPSSTYVQAPLGIFFIYIGAGGRTMYVYGDFLLLTKQQRKMGLHGVATPLSMPNGTLTTVLVFQIFIHVTVTWDGFLIYCTSTSTETSLKAHSSGVTTRDC